MHIFKKFFVLLFVVNTIAQLSAKDYFGRFIDNFFHNIEKSVQTSVQPLDSRCVTHNELYTLPASDHILDAHTENGSITIKSAQVNQITIEVLYKGKDHNEIDQLKQLTHISHNETHCTINQTLPHYRSNYCSVSFAITVPTTVKVKRLYSSNGSITTHEVAHVEHVKSLNGKIQLTNVATSVVAKTSNGKVEIVSAHNNTNPIKAKTSNGTIILANIQGNAKAHTSNGSIDIATCNNYTGKLTYKTSNGSVYINGKKVKKHS